MDEKILLELLHEREEKDWFDFKRELKLYQAAGKLIEMKRDELIKDILGLANGNSHIIRKTKYLIIGADDKEFDDDGCRVLHDVDYKTPSRSDLSKWLNSASSPSITGLDCEEIVINGKNLLVFIIPPTFDFHEIIRDLITPSGTYRKNTVFMRQDEHTVPASVREGVTIEKLKHLHRQEVENPPAIFVSILVGGFVGFFIGNAKVRPTMMEYQIAENIMRIILTFSGMVLGSVIGLNVKLWNTTRYDFRYMSLWQRAIVIVSIVIAAIILFLVI